jgi:amidase
LGLKYQAETSLELDDPVYIAATHQGMDYIHAAMEGLFANYKLAALLYPTSPTPIALVKLPDEVPARGEGGNSPLNIANITGFPDLVVPAGMSKLGLPVTFSLMGRAFSEGRLLSFAYDYEQATQAITLPVNTPTLASDQLTKD